VLVEATEAIAPFEAEVFGALIERMNALLGQYTDEQLETIRHYLDHAATAIGRSGPAGSEPRHRAATPATAQEARSATRTRGRAKR